MDQQVKNSFDKSTVIKIGKGAGIAACGAAALYILGAIQAIDFGSMWTPIVAALVPIIVNAIREWIKGEGVELPK